jgi:hypothetical protein
MCTHKCSKLTSVVVHLQKTHTRDGGDEPHLPLIYFRKLGHKNAIKHDNRGPQVPASIEFTKKPQKIPCLYVLYLTDW